MKIACVGLQPAVPNFWEIVPAPRYGTMTVASALRQAGFDVTGLVENISSHIEEEAARADIIAFTVLSSSAKKCYAMADKFRRMGKTVIFGGTHTNYFLEDSLRHCDYVVLGDAEGPLIDLVKRLSSSQAVDDIPGLAWMEKGRLRQNPREPDQRRFHGTVDLTLIKDYPAFIKRRRWFWAPLVFQATRGCPFHCSFCITGKMFGKKFYCRGIDEVLEDLEDKLRYSKDIHFVDNNFGGNINYARRLLEAMIKAKISMRATIYVRYEFARHTDLLGMMRKVGFNRLLVGVDSFNDTTLDDLDKRQDFRSVQEAIRTFKRYGFRISGTFIMGAGNETPETAKQYLEVARKLDIDYAFFFMYGIYPETCTEAFPKERVFFNDYDYGTGHFIFFFPKYIRPSVLQQELMDAHIAFYSRKRILRSLIRGKWRDAVELFVHRRFCLHLRPSVEKYIKYLQELEQGLYRGNILDVEALRRREIPKLESFRDDDRLAERGVASRGGAETKYASIA